MLDNDTEEYHKNYMNIYNPEREILSLIPLDVAARKISGVGVLGNLAAPVGIGLQFVRNKRDGY